MTTNLTDRDAVTSAFTQATQNIPFFVSFAGLALLVGFLPGWLAWLQVPVAVVLIAASALFSLQDLFSLSIGLFRLVSYPFHKGEAGNPFWLAAGCLLNIVQGAVWIGLAYYVGHQAGWWA